MRHQPEIDDDAPCCPLATIGRPVLRGLPDLPEPQRHVGSLYVLCSADGSPVADDIAEFEDWLARTFPDVRILERGKRGPHAVLWMRHTCTRPSRLDGWLSPDRTTVYLIGDADLARQTATAVRALFWAKGVGVSDIGVARLPAMVDRRRPGWLDAPATRRFLPQGHERRASPLRHVGRSASR